MNSRISKSWCLTVAVDQFGLARFVDFFCPALFDWVSAATVDYYTVVSEKRLINERDINKFHETVHL